jgi:beta-phosphoglucomutase-like phosphatase (HAD superfamily)
MVSEKWEMIREWLKDGHPKPLDDIINLIFDLKKRKIPIIIASASPRWYIEEMLKKSVWERNSSEIRLNYIRYPLKNYFGDNYVSAEEVLNPKPDPDVFLAAAERLGVDPKKCLVIGDGRSDVYGGVSAGMNVLFLGQEDEEIKNLSAVKAFDTDSLLYNYVKQVHFNKTF